MSAYAWKVLPLISDKLPQIAALCERLGVTRLDLFGSATGRSLRSFEPRRSDFDFVAEFTAVPGLAADDQYFGLIEELEALFGRSVDVVDEHAIRNPYFRRVIDSEREPVYVARGEEAVDVAGAADTHP